MLKSVPTLNFPRHLHSERNVIHNALVFNSSLIGHIGNFISAKCDCSGGVDSFSLTAALTAYLSKHWNQTKKKKHWSDNKSRSSFYLRTIYPFICSFRPSVHGSISYLYRLSIRVVGTLEPIPADFSFFVFSSHKSVVFFISYQFFFSFQFNFNKFFFLVKSVTTVLYICGFICEFLTFFLRRLFCKFVTMFW